MNIFIRSNEYEEKNNEMTDNTYGDYIVIHFENIEVDNNIFNSILEKVTDRLDRYFKNKNIEFSTIELKSNGGFENKDINFVIELYLADGIHLKDIPNMPSDNKIIEIVKQWIDEYLSEIP